MIEKTVLDYLKSELNVSVFMERPAKAKYPYALLELTGGDKVNQIRTATIAVQSYAETLFDAASLNDEVLNAMDGIINIVDISKCTLNSYYNYTNTTTKEYRYQAVFDLVYMEG